MQKWKSLFPQENKGKITLYFKKKKKKDKKGKRLLNKTFPTLIKDAYFSLPPVCATAGPQHSPAPRRAGSLGERPEEKDPMKMPKSPGEEGLQDTRWSLPPAQGGWYKAMTADSSELSELREKIQREKGAEGSKGGDRSSTESQNGWGWKGPLWEAVGRDNVGPRLDKVLCSLL